MEDSILDSIGEEVHDANEETYDLFSQPRPSHSLGMVDPSAAVLEVTIAGRDYEVAQSPAILQSSRQAGTTGAAVWQSSVRLAEWLATEDNPLSRHGVLTSKSVVMELGSGISGIVPCVLGPRSHRVIATDQPYLLKLLRENVEKNNSHISTAAKSSKRTQKIPSTKSSTNISVCPLDWETDDIGSFMTTHDLSNGVDLLLGCDCIYNYALIDPFVQTCAEVCRQRQRQRDDSHSDDVDAQCSPTFCLIAQQLRQPEVFEQWLETCLRSFRVWRVGDEVVPENLRGGSGFVLHLCILREGGK